MGPDAPNQMGGNLQRLAGPIALKSAVRESWKPPAIFACIYKDGNGFLFFKFGFFLLSSKSIMTTETKLQHVGIYQ